MQTVSTAETRSPGDRPSASEAEYQVRKLATRYSHLFAQHQWPSEHLRWTELLFALACRIARGRPEQEIRLAIANLDGMNLLQVDDLAKVAPGDGQPRASEAHTARLSSELRELGFSDTEIDETLIAMARAARAVKERYEGKIQLFLRKYGEVMARELVDAISPPAASRASTADAVRYWLQNVLDMPIVLDQAGMQAFCAEHGITEAELTMEADRQDLNVALLDDMIDQRQADEAKKGTAHA